MLGSASSSDGTRITYRVHGSGSRSVLLVHGWMASGGVFTELLEAWRPAGVRVIVPDLRGAGDSDEAQDGYTLERYAEDIVAVLDAERIERAPLVAHSMGGQIAQLVAASRPERVAGLCAVLPVPADGLPLPADAAAVFRSAGGQPEVLGRILDMASPALPRAIRERLLADALTIAPRCIAEAFDAWSRGGFAERLASITAPVTVVASGDPFLPVALLRAKVAERIAGARLLEIEGAGHYAPNEQPRALAAILDEGLAGWAP